MSEPRNCPAKRDWSDWLAGSGPIAVDEDRLLEHLDRCPRCQQAVAELNADDPFYCQSRDALRSTGLTSRDWQESACSVHPIPEIESSNPAIVSLVQALLGPSDDDRSLGRLGRFEVFGIVGSGGMGIVLKARSIDMDRVVAIKIPQPQFWQSPDTLLTLEREARSAAAVIHPNVISIYHVDRYRDVPYLVMPYLPGQSLEQRIRQTGPMPIDETLRIGRQVASALAAAHACGVVHRDVKPANILLGAGTERVILSDFGLAKIQSDATCTATGTFAGTPIYLSPEQALGYGMGPAGDLYSLGTVLWTMLCGKPPLCGMHTHAIVNRIAGSEIPPLADHCPGVPDWLDRLVAKLHASIPADRPSAEQLTEWIEACQRHLADERSAPLPEELRVDRSNRQPRLVWSAVAAATLGIVLTGWQLSQGSSKRSPRDESTSTVQTQTDSSVTNSSVTNASPPQTTQQPPTQQPPTSDPTEPVVEFDETDLFLNQVQAELSELNQRTLPNWESQLQQWSQPTP